MGDQSLIEWVYETILRGHETPILAVLILGIVGVVIMTWKGWIRIGPAHVKDETVYGEMATPSKMSDETRRHLYQADGTTKYMPRSECLMDRADCESGICKAIEKLDGKIEAAQARMEKKETERTKETRELVFFLGRVDEFMRKNGG